MRYGVKSPEYQAYIKHCEKRELKPMNPDGFSYHFKRNMEDMLHITATRKGWRYDKNEYKKQWYHSTKQKNAEMFRILEEKRKQMGIFL